MNKAYSNKALPAGTVLREWRIEDVLGVGGFGIVYRAQGIYFNELVAIKEYFPSSISERDSEDTVVPIDSEAEEVHALGLKKFVEEAKLLWNLSTPTRHPNIVSVRSLFEIHGTAYIVMDFEDGVSLSKMLKQGRRFNERSLWNILRPIAEGLETAHRVGVLHRDIKPPNILINEDNRPVLIDFGSARFAAAEATSTTVTFHTPPYAAIEQYVKTYPQGPWTDIYALGVVMYECITGEKPPEVLERLHAGLGKPLSDGKWPGYSKRFLAAIDAAMLVKPDERPQALTDWLAMFGKVQTADEPEADEATRFFAKQVETDDIVPVPPTPNVDRKAAVETRVPADPKDAEFKRAGEETSAARKLKSEQAAAQASEETLNRKRIPEVAAAAAPAPAPTKAAKASEGAATKKKPSVAVLAGVAGAVVLVAGVAAMTLGGGSGDPNAPTTLSHAEATDGTIDLSAEGAANAADLNVLNAEDQGATLPDRVQVGEEPSATAGPSRDAARAAAAEARLKALERATARSARAKAAASAASSVAAKPDEKAAAATSTASTASKKGVSSAKASQFYSTVDEGRSMAKRVIRSQSGQNAELARSYDSYLKSLRGSMRAAKSDEEADKLIRQARLYRAYVQTLQK
jgi:serine/threonine protein kinase